MKKGILSTTIFLFLAFCLLGQNTESNKNLYRPVDKVKAADFFDYYKHMEGGMENITMVATPAGRSKHSSTHPKYKQTYKGVEVYGSSYSLHLKDGLVNYATGKMYTDINIDVNPSISEESAKSNAIKHVQRKISNASDKPLRHDKMTSEIKGLVVIDMLYPKTSGEYTLAYKIEVKSLLQAIKYEVIASAVNNTIIFDQSLIKHGNVNGIGKTFYYGNQNIVTDSTAPNRFVLRDLTRGITTLSNANGNNNELIVNTNNVWDNDSINDLVAIDAHYTTSKFYDMMVEHFGYLGVDGEGSSMNPVIHVGGDDNYLNAFWDGDNAYFGHGDCHHGPLTTLSVVGHEFTHGITQYNSNLIYDGESGALNEAFSDIFGKSLEYFVDNDNFSWDLGPEFALSKFSRTFRSMSNPNLQGNPKRYKGEYWEDNADVHFNSGVLNHWFYLLVEGVTGESEGIPFAVNKMDIDEVLQVLFLCQTSYLTPSSDYPAMYEFTLLACEELYGTNSPQLASMHEAWKAVGLPVDISNEDVLDLAISTPNFYEVTCISDSFHPLQLVISNFGTVSVEKGEILEIQFDEESKFVTLEKTLMPGENIVIILDDLLYLSETDIDFYSLTLFFYDDKSSNNNTSFIIDNYAASLPDVVLYSSEVTDNSCQSSFVEILTYLGNNSCQEVPINTEISLKIYDGFTFVKEIKEVLKTPIFGGDVYPINFTLEPQSNSYNIEVECAIDSEVSNNSEILYISDSKIVDKVFAYDFETYEFDDAFKVRGQIEHSDYEGGTYLASSGYYSSSAPCPDLERNFEDLYSGLVSLATACIDLTSFSNPRLSFDMIQFRSGKYDFFEDPEVSSQTSMINLKYYNDEQTFTTYIYGQPEEQIINHSFNLPQGFVGKLELAFYNNSGNGYFSEFNTDEIDAILIDNLILEDVNSTVNADPSHFKLQPNPASDYITLYTSPLYNSVALIYNAQGQLMKNITLSPAGNEHKISIAEINSGYYILKIYNNESAPIVLPFVKI